MDKLIQLGIQARLHDIKIQNIETLCYSGEISEGKALDLVIQENVRYSRIAKKILDSGKISKKQFMKEQHLLALPN